MPGLFDDFNPVTSKQWKQQIQYELKGAEYNDLIWESPEGIKVKPFYHRDEETALEPAASNEGFCICQDIFVFDLDKSIARAKKSLDRGAESIRFIIQDATTDVGRIVREIGTAAKVIYFSLEFVSEEKILEIDRAAGPVPATIFVSTDPIHRLATDGNWYPTKSKSNLESLADVSRNARNINLACVDGAHYQNAGANITQQITYALSHANEYFNSFPGLDGPVLIRVAIGPNYFFEIAKLRALRLLFNIVAKEYGHHSGCHILATPSKRNKTIYDYNVNMLRSTTECMSAVLGGADSVCNMPYDALYHKSNEFGERISRNQLLILKHESYFDKTANAADGSYYIESLTKQLASKSLELFKEIERNGGLIKQLISGTIQRKISESAQKEQEKFDSGAEVLVGANKHPNKHDRMAADLELFPFAKKPTHKMMITPIVEKRLAEKLEQQRLETEKENQ